MEAQKSKRNPFSGVDARQSNAARLLIRALIWQISLKQAGRQGQLPVILRPINNLSNTSHLLFQQFSFLGFS